MQAVDEKQTFGEYGPYQVDRFGVPLLSDVVWDMLGRLEMSVEEFGIRFGKLTRKNKKPYTKSRIYQMLRDNCFPEEKSRRWVLAKLLQIPPLLLGIKHLEEILDTRQVPSLVVTKPKGVPPTFDLPEYQITLTTYWKKHRLLLSSDRELDIEERIGVLEKEYMYGARESRQRVASLLCGYHMISSNIATDQREFDDAITHLNKAYIVAKGRKLVKLEGACLLRRGWALKERGEERTVNSQVGLALEDFAFATKDFTLALATKGSAGMHGSILLSLGKLNANRSTTPGEFHQAIIQIDKAEPFLKQKADEGDIHFIQLDEERYYLDRAAAYLASANPLACYPRDARRELRNAIAFSPSPIPQRRHAYNLILEAKSYVIEGTTSLQKKRVSDADCAFVQATTKASQALTIVRDIHSTINLGRIEHIYAQVKETPFAQGSVDLASLEVELMTTKHPEMFL